MQCYLHYKNQSKYILSFFGRNWTKIEYLAWLLQKFIRMLIWKIISLSHSKLPYCYQKNYWINPFISQLTKKFQIIWRENKAFWNATVFLFSIVHLKVTLKMCSDYLTYWFGLSSPILGLDNVKSPKISICNILLVVI